ncbi:hypothetical protein Tco_0359817 [Tanacetum coccineum]
MELKTSSSFKTTGLLQPWQTLCKIFFKCLTTRVTGWDQPPLQIMQMMRSTRLTPPALVPTDDKAYEMILQDTIQISLAEHKVEKSKKLEKMLLYSFVSPESESTLSKSTSSNAKSRFLLRKSFDTLADHLQEVMVESLPTMVDTHIKEQVKKQVPEQVRDQVPIVGIYRLKFPHKFRTLLIITFLLKLMRQHPQQQQQDIAIWFGNPQMKLTNRLQVQQTTCRLSAVRLRDQDDPYDDAHPEGENSAKRQKTSEYEAYVSGESSSWTSQ